MNIIVYTVTVRGNVVTSSALRAHHGADRYAWAERLDEILGVAVFPTESEAYEFAEYFKSTFPEPPDTPTVNLRVLRGVTVQPGHLVEEEIEIIEELDHAQEEAERRGGYGGGTL
jgi:hypothetical protein